jgi:hypothetical protein
VQPSFGSVRSSWITKKRPGKDTHPNYCFSELYPFGKAMKITERGIIHVKEIVEIILVLF